MSSVFNVDIVSEILHYAEFLASLSLLLVRWAPGIELAPAESYY